MNSTFPAISPAPLDPSALVMYLAGDRVCAGFPSPAEDFAVQRIDLTAILVIHPQPTFLRRDSGDSMREAGIFDGDTLVIDKANPTMAAKFAELPGTLSSTETE